MSQPPPADQSLPSPPEPTPPTSAEPSVEPVQPDPQADPNASPFSRPALDYIEKGANDNGIERW